MFGLQLFYTIQKYVFFLKTVFVYFPDPESLHLDPVFSQGLRLTLKVLICMGFSTTIKVVGSTGVTKDDMSANTTPVYVNAYFINIKHFLSKFLFIFKDFLSCDTVVLTQSETL